MTSQLGFGGPGYDTRAPERPITAGDAVVRGGERFAVLAADQDVNGRIVLVCVSCASGRERVLLGAAPGKAQEWDYDVAHRPRPLPAGWRDRLARGLEHPDPDVIANPPDLPD